VSERTIRAAPAPDAPAPDDRHDAVAGRRILTVPNVLSFSRIIGSVILIWIAWIGAEGWFIGVFLGFLFTDWLDGKLAVALHQRTLLGARLDTVGDGILYLCLLIGVPLLEPDFLAANGLLVTLMLVSHFAAAGASVIKFRRIPAYHTRAAKTCWLLVCVGTVALLAGGPVWPARLALAAVILTNLQSIAMTMTLPRWEADVSSWWHARRIARRSAGTS
jgi:CDP-diacylglycerol--glycerol-3-phosphate 3-phosphatidyltransferase